MTYLSPKKIREEKIAGIVGAVAVVAMLFGIALLLA